MPAASWHDILAASADPARARHHLHLLRDAGGGPHLDRILATEGAGTILAAVLAGSRALPALLIHHPGWLEDFLDPETLRHPRRKQGLLRDTRARLDATPRPRTPAEVREVLHELRLREHLRIGTRDLTRLGGLEDLMLEVSNAAEVFLQGLLEGVWTELTERFGRPWHPTPSGAWQETGFSILGLGKLGGQELNPSSDVDLLFVYTEEGTTFRNPPTARRPGQGVLPNHQFFKRLAEALIREATARAPEAGGLRVDLRLRPEGDAGPLARSIDSYETYYAAWGRTWERMMLIKARPVAGDPGLGAEFLEMIQPFRYPRSLPETILGEMSGLKTRIEQEVVPAGELDRHVKLGRGGIREIEFIAQSLQILHAGRNPFLQSPQTLAALRLLARYRVIPPTDANRLDHAYRFLRETEHRLQLEDLAQTHTLPTNAQDLQRLALGAGFRHASAFQRTLRSHTRHVRTIYRRVFAPPATTSTATSTATRTPQPRGLPAFPTGFTDPETWRALLRARGFADPDTGIRLLQEFVHGPGYVHVSPRTSELAWQLLPRLLGRCPTRPPRPAPRRRTAGQDRDFVLSDPDRVLNRLDSYIQAYGTRASLYELWNVRPHVLDHLLLLLDRSEFLAERVIRNPDLVDQLEAGDHLRHRKDAGSTLADLRHGADDPDQRLWIRRYFQTEFTRLGLRNILGLTDDLGASAELTALAEACLRYALEVLTRRHRLPTAPFAVIGLGRLGGGELVFGSDLDVLFVAPDATRNLPRLQRIASEFLDLLGTRTELGQVFALDARLRPDGTKGLLVNVLHAHQDYYRQRAALWELQALTRARAVAGPPDTGAAFEALARGLTDFRSPATPPAAWSPEWRTEIARMRTRIEHERTAPGQEALSFKTGAGGLIDVEFLAQTLAMDHGWFEPNTLRSLERAAALRVAPAAALRTLILDYRRLRRMESILRRWSFEGETVLPPDPAALDRVATRCGLADGARLLAEVTRWRTRIRSVYQRLLPSAEPPPGGRGSDGGRGRREAGGAKGETQFPG